MNIKSIEVSNGLRINEVANVNIMNENVAKSNDKPMLRRKTTNHRNIHNDAKLRKQLQSTVKEKNYECSMCKHSYDTIDEADICCRDKVARVPRKRKHVTQKNKARSRGNIKWINDNASIVSHFGDEIISVLNKCLKVAGYDKRNNAFKREFGAVLFSKILVQKFGDNESKEREQKTINDERATSSKLPRENIMEKQSNIDNQIIIFNENLRNSDSNEEITESNIDLVDSDVDVRSSFEYNTRKKRIIEEEQLELVFDSESTPNQAKETDNLKSILDEKVVRNIDRLDMNVKNGKVLNGSNINDELHVFDEDLKYCDSNKKFPKIKLIPIDDSSDSTRGSFVYNRRNEEIFNEEDLECDDDLGLPKNPPQENENSMAILDENVEKSDDSSDENVTSSEVLNECLSKDLRKIFTNAESMKREQKKVNETKVRQREEINLMSDDSSTEHQSNRQKRKRDNFWQTYAHVLEGERKKFTITIRHFIIHYIMYYLFKELNLDNYKGKQLSKVMNSNFFRDTGVLKWFDNGESEFQNVCKAAKRNLREVDKKTSILLKCRNVTYSSSYDTTLLNALPIEELNELLFSNVSPDIIQYIATLRVPKDSRK